MDMDWLSRVAPWLRDHLAGAGGGAIPQSNSFGDRGWPFFGNTGQSPGAPTSLQALAGGRGPLVNPGFTPPQGGGRPFAMRGYAEGGRPEPGEPAVVGEKGPEAFVPDKAGTKMSVAEIIRMIRELTDPGRFMAQPGPRSGSVMRDMAEEGLPLATMGLQPRAVKLSPIGDTTRMQVGNRFVRQPYTTHPARGAFPAVAALQAAGPAQHALGVQTVPPQMPESTLPVATPPDNEVDSREMPVSMEGSPPQVASQPEPAPVAETPAARPLFMESGEMAAPPAASLAPVPLPRPKPAPNKPQQRKPAPQPESPLQALVRALRLADLSAPSSGQKRNATPGGHYAEGGRPPEGEASVVGEKGPEVFVPDQPGTIVPHWLASALAEMPPERAPLTKALPDYEQRDPRELAALRMQQATKPQQGRADVSPEFIQALLSAAGGPTVRAISLAPKVATALGAGGLVLSGTSGAGEAAEQTGFPEPQPVLRKEDQIKINDLTAQIQTARQTIARFAAQKETNPAAYARNTAQANAALQVLVPQLNAIEGQHKTALAGWQQRMNDYMTKTNTEALEKQKRIEAASMPFQEKHPWWNEDVQKYGTGAEATLGLLAGLTGKGGVVKPLLTGGGLGGLAGGLAALYPTLQDAGYLPYGSENQKKAAAQWRDPEFLADKVLPEALAGAGVGMLGAGVGSKGPTITKATTESIRDIMKWLKNPMGAKAPRVAKPKVMESAPAAAPTAPAQEAATKLPANPLRKFDDQGNPINRGPATPSLQDMVEPTRRAHVPRRTKKAENG